MARISEYPEVMNETSSRSLGRTVVAGLILLVAGYFLLHVVLSVVAAVAGIVVVVLAIVGVIWAVRTLL
jgi:protein-S-isoprenylcysteine O-methyltransferase Ste14